MKEPLFRLKLMVENSEHWCFLQLNQDFKQTNAYKILGTNVIYSPLSLPYVLVIFIIFVNIIFYGFVILDFII